MLRVLALLVVGGCASGVCDSCPSVALAVNGTTAITAPAGTPLTYTWSSANADAAISTVAISPSSPDACGNHDGPWVIDTLSGTTDPVALAPCPVGLRVHARGHRHAGRDRDDRVRGHRGDGPVG